MKHFPYSVPERRALTEQERDLVLVLLSRVAPARAREVEELEVYARCGCGKCPTIMFEPAREKEAEPKQIIADFVGDEELVGVILWEREGRLSELEGWSLDGKEPIVWPAIGTLKPFRSEPRE